MSHSQDEIHKENLIQDYRELLERWNGKDLGLEARLNDMAGELFEYGIDVEDLP